VRKRFWCRKLCTPAAVSAYVGGRVRQPEVIFDLVAETFARALENRDRYDADRGPAIAWLLGIARNLILDSFRRGQVEAAGRIRLGMTPVELEDEQLESIARRGRIDLREALASLPAPQREGVIRRVLLDESYAEMARDLRCSEQVVRKRVSRAWLVVHGGSGSAQRLRVLEALRISKLDLRR
jgi:RNA polymerase sigma-70 factor, ECF subfamily